MRSTHSLPHASAADRSLVEQTAPALLVVGHPGHELRVHAWIERARPTVCVLTDGSGSTGEGRLESTTRLLERAGARPGAVYGRLSDRAVYAAILDGEREVFLDLADELCAAILAEGATCVVGDAAEGYNPCHDVCRLVINAAVRMAVRACGAPIANLDFALVGAPDVGTADGAAPRPGSAHVELSEEALARKLAAAREYPEMAREVEAALERFGVAPFRHEVLRAVDTDDRLAWPADQTPFYERHGERRVAEGVYDRVLRFQEHVVPIAEALWSHRGVAG